LGRITESIMAENKRPGSKCNVKKAIDAMAPGDASELVDVLGVAGQTGGPSYSAVTRFLRAEGFDVGGNAVSNHCGGSCSCGPRH